MPPSLLSLPQRMWECSDRWAFVYHLQCGKAECRFGGEKTHEWQGSSIWRIWLYKCIASPPLASCHPQGLKTAPWQQHVPNLPPGRAVTAACLSNGISASSGKEPGANMHAQVTALCHRASSGTSSWACKSQTSEHLLGCLLLPISAQNQI